MSMSDLPTAALKAALLSLPATGEDGFEGIMAVTLGAFSGRAFRRAKGGSQRGQDGATADPDGGIAFEAKLYTEKIRRTEVITKIADLGRRTREADLVWVLGATVPLPTQDAEDLHADAARDGVSVLILDWPEGACPPLAAALAGAGAAVDDVLRRTVKDAAILTPALDALAALRTDPEVAREAERLRSELDAPMVATEAARLANVKWLETAFADPRAARRRFGQALAPAAEGTTLPRSNLVSALAPAFTGPPTGGLVAVLGGEGCGKSWCAVQAWLSVHLEQRPLTLVIGAEALPEAAPDEHGLKDLLIDQFIAQTGDQRSQPLVGRWRRRLHAWTLRREHRPRVVVVIDGLNQRPGTAWCRLLDHLAEVLQEVGGTLIVTSRTRYFTDRVRSGLYAPVSEVAVPEWTAEDRDQLLRAAGVRPDDLASAVAGRLRNPRLLGIALTLFTGAEIASLQELTTSRLLFEHIRTAHRSGTSEPPITFFTRLADDAQTVLDRMIRQDHDDLSVFARDEVPAVAEGRFYHALPGEAGRYRLDDDGLTLALGFALLRVCRRALRNGRDVDQALAEVVEPVAALDDTAQVVMAALTAACLGDDEDRDTLTAPLARHFADLQNPHADLFPTLCGLVRRAPRGFLNALEGLSLTEARRPNEDWVFGALAEAREDETAWPEILSAVRRWLRTYSLSTDTQVLRGEGEPGAVDERRKAETRREARLGALSAAERALLDGMERRDVNLGPLWTQALRLLAGMALAPTAEALAALAFGMALNGGFRAPNDEFHALVTFNTRDWEPARDALITSCRPFAGPEASSTGRWARVTVLRAIGDAAAASKAAPIIDDLTAGRPGPESWRRVETYCATDPCDPGASEPDNVASTADRYELQNVEQIATSMDVTSADRFLRMAAPGVARFRPHAAVAVHRRLIADSARRTGLALQQVAWEARRHGALLTPDLIRILIDTSRRVFRDGPSADISDREQWVVAQSFLLPAFPHLPPDAQIDLLLEIPDGQPVLLDLFEQLMPIDAATFDAKLKTSGNSAHRLNLLLFAAGCGKADLSEDARAFVAASVQADDDLVRSAALAAAAHLRDHRALQAVVDGGWTAQPNDDLENHNGSVALLRAVDAGLIEPEGALNRISPRLYPAAVEHLQPAQVRLIAVRLDRAVRHLLDLPPEAAVPPVDVEVRLNRAGAPAILHIDERRVGKPDMRDIFDRLSESPAAAEERHRRRMAAFETFLDRLTETAAWIVLDEVAAPAMTSLLRHAGDLVRPWADGFLDLSDSDLRRVHGPAVALARGLWETEPKVAAALLRRCTGVDPITRIVSGAAKVDQLTLAVWQAPRHPDIDALRFARLDCAPHDHALAQEALAAHLADRRDLVHDYIRARLDRVEPALQARALMLAGLCDKHPEIDRILAAYAATPGLLGEAQEAARYAYDRNTWAREWYTRLCTADDPVMFWRAQILFHKIVDGRFEIWRDEVAWAGDPVRRFFSIDLHQRLESRCKKWEDKRRTTLFGRSVPDAWYLPKSTVR